MGTMSCSPTFETTPCFVSVFISPKFSLETHPSLVEGERVECQSG
ncbi:hypothetical protein L914_06907 [Phytophthora nicotianae]|uniref:Uncharacterized protein n=1 Tax=Phytophthora nicotianae TaxID=4792 RepID=W2NIT3_PHYNI|nr:hypothetical protein L914_06907 [Phytophthora nicotianae]